MENLSAYNRKIIDRTANRYFFITNPVRIDVTGLKAKKIEIPLHPDVKRGFRKFNLSRTFYIDADDFENYKGVEVRLKDLCNIKLDKISEFTGFDVKATPKIHWVPAKHVTMRVHTPEKDIKGYAEMNLLKEKIGAAVQLERFGFVKIEKTGKGGITAIFSHR